MVVRIGLVSAVEMEVWDWDRSGDDDFIGSCTWSFVELTECAARGESFQRDLMAKGKQSGAVEFRNVRWSYIWLYSCSYTEHTRGNWVIATRKSPTMKHHPALDEQ